MSSIEEQFDKVLDTVSGLFSSQATQKRRRNSAGTGSVTATTAGSSVRQDSQDVPTGLSSAAEQWVQEGVQASLKAWGTATAAKFKEHDAKLSELGQAVDTNGAQIYALQQENAITKASLKHQRPARRSQGRQKQPGKPRGVRRSQEQPT